jgi:hypothetical protein
MRVPLKLGDIDREHLQELYDAAGVARDELPYTPAFEQIWQGFQDRTFKNADREQIFGALIKYVRSSSCPSKPQPASANPPLTEEQLKQLKTMLRRFAVNGRVLPYSDEFADALKTFNQTAGTQLNDQEFWQSIVRAQGARRPPKPPRRKAEVKEQSEDAADEDGE